MVKVFPSNFTLFEQQNIFTPSSGEPLAISCSDECLLVAVEGCVIEVYEIDTLEPVAQFRTVNPVAQFSYNAKGDCIVTLERKSSYSHGFARVYFKWRGSSVDKPMRVNPLDSSTREGANMQYQDRIAAEIIELPTESSSSVSCLTCCKQSGQIAIGMGSIIRIFSLLPPLDNGAVSSDTAAATDESSQTSTSWEHIAPRIEILLDIHTSLPLKKVAIFGSYVAYISSFEARVLKISLFRSNEGRGPSPKDCQGLESRMESPRMGTEQHYYRSERPILEDPTFVCWSPSKVWEKERQFSSTPAAADPNSSTTSDDHRTLSHEPSIGTLSLATISAATSQQLTERHPVEVLGPAEYVQGHPVQVLIEGFESSTCSVEEDLPPSSSSPSSPPSSSSSRHKCRVLTMLYRRFLPAVPQAAQTGGTGPEGGGVRGARSGTLPTHSKLHHGGGGGGVLQIGSEGLHSVQLLPTLTHDDKNGKQVVGVSCFLANHRHGYLYDVHRKTKLVSSFSFMSKAHMVSCDPSFIHALSDNAVESYTNRVFHSALSNMPEGDTDCLAPGEIGRDRAQEDFLKQPCPHPSMDLMLVSANKFIGSCCLATSENHMIVLTKIVEPPPADPEPPPSSNWLLQSLSLRRPQKEAREPSWNVYILRRKETLDLYQQFSEFADSLKETSPPMYQQVVSEGHVLLRNQLTNQSDPSSKLLPLLRQSCSRLAGSLCGFPAKDVTVAMAARYFLLSRLSVAEVFQFISQNFDKGATRAYAVLLSYLNFVLFDQRNGPAQSAALSPLADAVLQVYSELEPASFTRVLLSSWLIGYSPSHARELLQAIQRQASNTTSSSSSSSAEANVVLLCEVLLCVQLDDLTAARERLQQLPEDFLTAWLKENRHFLVEEGQSITKLGELILEQREECVLDVLSFCLSEGLLDLTCVCSLLGGGRGLPGSYDLSHDQELADNVLLKQFLERIILGRIEIKSIESTRQAVLLLVDVVFARLLAEKTPKASNSAPFSLYGNRFKWLDSLPPFDGSLDPKPSQTMLQDLMQLQALFCSSHMTCQVASHVLGLVEGRGESELPGNTSLRLLVWPHVDKMDEALQLVLQRAPQLAVELCLSCLPRSLPPWQRLLQLLLGRLQQQEEDSSSGAAQLRGTFTSLYSAALEHVVSMTTPQEFLAVLPSSGCLHFYLPFVEHSCRLHVSGLVARQLHATATDERSSS